MTRSSRLMERARLVIPGGVNSPVRAFGAVGGEPPFIVRGEGAFLYDEDGRSYLDLVGSWGALLLGHARSEVVDAACQAIQRGSSFGAPTEAEIHLAESIRDRVPSMERVRLVSSGTEATMHAIRLARGYTGRDLIVKMDGCYHGAHDAVLVSAGSGVATFAKPGSAGIPESVAANTLVVPYNDEEALETIFRQYGSKIAAILVEPVPGNMGCILPKDKYLNTLRQISHQHGALLIFDEVMSGFRVAMGGAQERYRVRPDLTCLGKIVGGGFPLAAFGGRKEIMEKLSPLGSVYQAGTLSGNPVAVAAGLATLELLSAEIYERIETIGQRLEEGLAQILHQMGWCIVRVGGMFTLYAHNEPPTQFLEVKRCDLDAFAKFHQAALKAGVYLPPSQFEAAFLSSILSDEQVDTIIRVISTSLTDLSPSR